MSLTLIKRFAVQILEALKFLKKQRIIHCDLKPENILLKEIDKLDIKIIDVGSSSFETGKLYHYVQSRYYRAPEVILGIPYSCSIDMWSFGCILAELFIGSPLFPGESEHEQLSLFIECLEVPPQYLINTGSHRKEYFDLNGKPIMKENSRGLIHFPGARTLSQRIKCEDSRFLNLIQRCLEWDPEKRITPEEALRHEWIAERIPIEVKCSKKNKRLSLERKTQNNSLVNTSRIKKDCTSITRFKSRQRNDSNKLNDNINRSVYKIKKMTTKIYKRQTDILPELKQRKIIEVSFNYE